jgi:peptide/nickel transport system substrate-binding protein
MNIYNRLWQVDPFTQDKVPDLAYAWEFESTEASGDIRDGQKWIFHLYENVTWHDGVPLNASDVAFTFEELAPHDPYHAKYLAHIYRIDTPDEYTVEMYTNQTKYFEFCDATNYYILPQHIWQHVSDPYTWEPETPFEMTGSGPYQWGSRSPSSHIQLHRHPRWHFMVEHPPRTLYPLSGPQWVQLIIISLGVIVIIILTGILGFLLHRRSGRKGQKNSTHKSWS